MEAGIDPLKKMAELIKAGAVMLAETCPVEGCNLPLFRLRSGEVVCPVHGRVLVVKTEEEYRDARSKLTTLAVLEKLEERALHEISERVEREELDPVEMVRWLEVIERIRRLKEVLRTSTR
ncbi:MAG: Sjogren's syndrome/scleroderma autoantigen 1 family protein [Desulfurococcaceae archaeon]